MDEDQEPEDAPPPEPLQFDVLYWDQDASNRRSWDAYGEDSQMVG